MEEPKIPAPRNKHVRSKRPCGERQDPGAAPEATADGRGKRAPEATNRAMFTYAPGAASGGPSFHEGTRESEHDAEAGSDPRPADSKPRPAPAAGTSEGYQGSGCSSRLFTEQRGGVRGSKSPYGPQRAPKNIRVTTRVDYQPYLCKDYNETGYCGFGDSCIYVHDRGDYKAGWELDREWEAKRNAAAEDGAGFAVEPAAEAPKECPICGRPFASPVVSECGHHFCEPCAVKRFVEDKTCAVCKSPLRGRFRPVKLAGTR